MVVNTMQHPLFSEADDELLHRSGNGYITKASFFLKSAGLENGSLVWEQSIFHACNKNEFKL